MKRSAMALFAGLVFGAGLALGGMTRPAKVVAFLDFAGDWDPSLAFVMGGAFLVYAIGYRWVARRGRPFFDAELHLPTRRDVDLPLVAGAVLFGAGWGLAGYCPGPAFVSLGSGGVPALLFAAAMVVGMALHHFVTLGVSRAPAPRKRRETA